MFSNFSLFAQLQDYDLNFVENSLNFSATGKGALGTNEYKFSLSLLRDIKSDAIKVHKTDGKVDILIPKVEKGFWMRLVSRLSSLFLFYFSSFVRFLDSDAPKAFMAENRFRQVEIGGRRH